MYSYSSIYVNALRPLGAILIQLLNEGPGPLAYTLTDEVNGRVINTINGVAAQGPVWHVLARLQRMPTETDRIVTIVFTTSSNEVIIKSFEPHSIKLVRSRDDVFSLGFLERVAGYSPPVDPL